jgi:hypothetical protein
VSTNNFKGDMALLTLGMTFEISQRILIATRDCRVCNVSHDVKILAVESGRVNLAGVLKCG